ncbi:28S ribosomal protein S10, mitochondrial [Condylostylus longicornis]|uniref:28S ribosomal protein S10, mitochondrial n=1 Tax=Condylostylus longicornis TaxID=2530218 RepID=UPI00244E1517|nr:28S ribosomal protein S10, mitochondrial [Condylostylus longicornis]
MLSLLAKFKPQRLLSQGNLSKYAISQTDFSNEVNPQKSEFFPIPEKDETEKDKLFSRLEIEVKSADPAVLKSYSWFATNAAEHLGIEIGNCWAQRKANHDRLTLLKSVHIYKKHRVQYEIRTYYRYMTFHKLTESTLDTFLEYIQRNLPEGVGMKCTKVEIQELPDHLKEPPKQAQSQI